MPLSRLTILKLELLFALFVDQMNLNKAEHVY